MPVRYPFLNLADTNARYADELHDAARRVIDSGRYIGGDEVDNFSRQLATLCKAPYAIGTSNGLDALRLILEAAKINGLIRDGAEVIVAANTYIASVLAITHAGLTPVLVDPDPDTMNISADAIEKAITTRTGAVMLVHLYGRMAWDRDIADVVSRHRLFVMEDAAQAIGAQSGCDGLFGSDMAGAIGHAGALSFYPTKNIGALGDAGAVVTHDKRLAETVRALANYGSDRRYHNILAGFNCRIDPIQAAILSEKIDDAVKAGARRAERAAVYSTLINNPLVITPSAPDFEASHVWHQYVIATVPEHRDWLRSYLLDNGVETDIHYPTPPHLQPCYTSLAHAPLPLTESLARSIISLPISDCTSTADTAAIAEIINRYS